MIYKKEKILAWLLLALIGYSLYFVPRFIESVINQLGNNTILNGLTNLLEFALYIASLSCAAVAVYLIFQESENKYLRNRLIRIFILYRTLMLFIQLPFTLYFYSYVYENTIPWTEIARISLLNLTTIAIIFFAVPICRIQSSQYSGKLITKRSTRFFHLLIDQTIIFTISSQFRDFFLLFLWQNQYGGEPNFFMTTMTGLLITFLYYLISEGIFKQTIGKMITNTYVGSTQGGYAPFGNIIGRTFGRMIPFEGLSYLNEPMGKVHDSISNTDVFEIGTPEAEDDFLLDHLVDTNWDSFK